MHAGSWLYKGKARASPQCLPAPILPTVYRRDIQHGSMHASSCGVGCVQWGHHRLAACYCPHQVMQASGACSTACRNGVPSNPDLCLKQL